MGKLFANFEPYDVQATRKSAREEEAENGMQRLVESLKEVNATRNTAVQQLIKHYGLSEEAALEKVNKYW